MDTSTVEAVLKKAIGLNASSIGNSSLTNAVNYRMKHLGMTNESSYFSLLESSFNEVNELVDEVTVNETWFFRDNKPFSAVVSFAGLWFAKNKKLIKNQQSSELSQINDLPSKHFPNFQHKTEHKLRILSLPCATGEEAYSLAISLLDAGYSKDSFQIDAIDINSKSLEIAKKAVYRDNSFRGDEAEIYKNKYFTRFSKGYILNKEFSSNIKFYKDNLIDPSSFFIHKSYHIIFCRNLLIYLNFPSQNKAINTLDNLLAPSGILFVGHAEHGVFAGSQFTPSKYPKTFSLVRKNEQKSEKPTKIQKPISVSEKQNNEKPDYSDNDRNIDLFTVDEIIAARLHLDKKEYDLAIEHCEKHIELNGPSSSAFFWIGNVLDEKKDSNNAIKALKKSIFLDPDNLDAMVLLSSIYSNCGDKKNLVSMKNRIKRVRDRLSNKIKTTM